MFLRNPPNQPISIAPNEFFGIPRELINPPQDMLKILAHLNNIEAKGKILQAKHPLLKHLPHDKDLDFTVLPVQGASYRPIWQRSQQDVVIKFNAKPSGISGNLQEIKNWEKYETRTTDVYSCFPIFGFTRQKQYILMAQAVACGLSQTANQKLLSKISGVAADYVPDPSINNLGYKTDASGARYWATVDMDFGMTFPD